MFCKIPSFNKKKTGPSIELNIENGEIVNISQDGDITPEMRADLYFVAMAHRIFKDSTKFKYSNWNTHYDDIHWETWYQLIYKNGKDVVTFSTTEKSKTVKFTWEEGVVYISSQDFHDDLMRKFNEVRLAEKMKPFENI